MLHTHRLFPTNDGAVIAHALVAVVPPNLMMSVRLSVKVTVLTSSTYQSVL